MVMLQLERKGAGLSVMVWFHGGAFTAGSGDTDMYGPQYLLDHDVVLVTVNYRLGIFGELHLSFLQHRNLSNREIANDRKHYFNKNYIYEVLGLLKSYQY
jgi:carboxylesterase type B